MLNLTTPNYTLAALRLFQEVHYTLTKTDGILSQVPDQVISHKGPIRNISGSSPVDHSFQSIRVSAEIPIEVITSTNIDKLTEILLHHSNELVRLKTKQLFEVIDDVTQSTGNVIDAKNQELTWDLIIDMIDKSEIYFDDEGNHKMSMVMNPDTAAKLEKIPFTDEDKSRLDRIILKKKEQFYASKLNRQLY